MKKLVISIALLAATMAVMAEDFSVTCKRPQAQAWPYKLASAPGMVLKEAPPGAIEEVIFATSGTHHGTNSKAMPCYAVPVAEPNGTLWVAIRLDGYPYCGNTVKKGSWFVPCPPLKASVSQEAPPPPTPAPPPETHSQGPLCGEEIHVPECRETVVCEQPCQVGAYSFYHEGGVDEHTIVTLFFSKERIEQERRRHHHNPPCPPEPPTCGPGHPPGEQPANGCNVLPTNGGTNNGVPNVPPPPAVI